MYLKVAVIVGHTSLAKGARAYNGESEYEFNSAVAREMFRTASISGNMAVSIYDRSRGGLSAVSRDMKNYDPHLSIELHFNSYMRRAYGSEILVYKNSKNFDKNILTASYIAKGLQDDFGTKLRGNIQVGPQSFKGVKALVNGRGLHNLKIIEMSNPDTQVMLVEPFFGNFKTKEAQSFIEGDGRIKYARSLLRSIEYAFTGMNRLITCSKCGQDLL